MKQVLSVFFMLVMFGLSEDIFAQARQFGIPNQDGLYSTGDNRFMFSTRQSSNPSDAIKLNPKNWYEAPSSNVWDDMWYAERIPETGNNIYLYGFKNFSNGDGEKILIQNSPQAWRVWSKDKGWQTLSDGQSMKFTFYSGGERIDIDVLNPVGNGTATVGSYKIGSGDSDVIFVSFGW